MSILSPQRKPSFQRQAVQSKWQAALQVKAPAHRKRQSLGAVCPPCSGHGNCLCRAGRNCQSGLQRSPCEELFGPKSNVGASQTATAVADDYCGVGTRAIRLENLVGEPAEHAQVVFAQIQLDRRSCMENNDTRSWLFAAASQAQNQQDCCSHGCLNKVKRHFAEAKGQHSLGLSLGALSTNQPDQSLQNRQKNGDHC